MKLTITRAGFLTTVQDLGRVGSRRFGVSMGGAPDLRGSFGGFEGRPLRDGDVISLARNSACAKTLVERLGQEEIAAWSVSHDWSSPAQQEPILRVVRGSDWDRFNDSAHHVLTSETFLVSPDSDRMGARLEGSEVRRREDCDLLSEACAPVKTPH